MEIILEPELETQNQGRAGPTKRCRWSSARFRAVWLKKGKIKLALVANYLKTSGRRNQVYYVKFISKLQFYIYNT